MACASCAKKAANRAKRLSVKYLNDPKRLTRLLREAERKGDTEKVNQLKQKLGI